LVFAINNTSFVPHPVPRPARACRPSRPAPFPPTPRRAPRVVCTAPCSEPHPAMACEATGPCAPQPGVEGSRRELKGVEGHLGRRPRSPDAVCRGRAPQQARRPQALCPAGPACGEAQATAGSPPIRGTASRRNEVAGGLQGRVAALPVTTGTPDAGRRRAPVTRLASGRPQVLVSVFPLTTGPPDAGRKRTSVTSLASGGLQGLASACPLSTGTPDAGRRRASGTRLAPGGRAKTCADCVSVGRRSARGQRTGAAASARAWPLRGRAAAAQRPQYPPKTRPHSRQNQRGCGVGAR